MHAIHFGAYLDAPDAGIEVPNVYGHDNPEGLHERIHLGNGIGAMVETYVSGSWACWGPADNSEWKDPDSDGDASIHIVVNVPDHFQITPEFVLALRWAIYDGDPSNDANYRLLDHAVISDADDWSVQTHAVLFRGNPEVSLYSINRKGFVS